MTWPSKIATKNKPRLNRRISSSERDAPLSIKGVPFIENGSEVVDVVEAVERDVDVMVVLVVVSVVIVVEAVLVVLEGVTTELDIDGGTA